MSDIEEREWIYDNLYFGNACYPSHEVWRYRGTQYQVLIWGAYKTEEEALDGIEIEKAFIDSFDHTIEYDDSSERFPWRTYAWYEPEDGRAMKMYIESKRAAWL